MSEGQKKISTIPLLLELWSRGPIGKNDSEWDYFMQRKNDLKEKRKEGFKNE